MSVDAIDQVERKRELARERNRRYYEKHREAVLARQRETAKRNPDKRLARARKYKAANPEKVAQMFRDASRRFAERNPDRVRDIRSTYRAAHKEQIAEAKRAHREKHANRIRIARAAYRKKHRERDGQAFAAWCAANPELVRIYKQNRRARELTGKLSRGIIGRLRALQRGRCAACASHLSKSGCHLDHIVALSRGGANTDDNVQLLCPKCNLQKHARDPIEFMQSRGFLL